MKDRWLAYVPALLLAGLALLTYWLDQRVQPQGRARDGALEQEPDFIVENFRAMRMHPDGTPRYLVAAKKMVHYPHDDSALLEAPELTHFDPQKAPVSIRANEGRLSPNGQDAFFSGDVLVRRAAYDDNEEVTLATSFLHVIPEKDLVKTDREVTMTRGKSTLKSVGLEFNNATRTMRLLSKVSGSFQTPPKSEPPWQQRR
ncbi:MAG TPA: LPS export ABC transporter periplasmic protein LptC [Burkholderiales bacterium]|nr:LPS export ABC transporter periplasmic protein LptC [Burkholderiales bacterium]